MPPHLPSGSGDTLFYPGRPSIRHKFLLRHLLQFYLDLFETLQAFCQGLKMCTSSGCKLIQRLILVTFHHLNLVIFLGGGGGKQPLLQFLPGSF